MAGALGLAVRFNASVPGRVETPWLEDGLGAGCHVASGQGECAGGTRRRNLTRRCCRCRAANSNAVPAGHLRQSVGRDVGAVPLRRSSQTWLIA